MQQTQALSGMAPAAAGDAGTPGAECPQGGSGVTTHHAAQLHIQLHQSMQERQLIQVWQGLHGKRERASTLHDGSSTVFLLAAATGTSMWRCMWQHGARSPRCTLYDLQLPECLNEDDKSILPYFKAVAVLLGCGVSLRLNLRRHSCRCPAALPARRCHHRPELWVLASAPPDPPQLFVTGLIIILDL